MRGYERRIFRHQTGSGEIRNIHHKQIEANLNFNWAFHFRSTLYLAGS